MYNLLIIINPKREVYNITSMKDCIEIKNREKNTYLNKIIGYRK